MENNILELEKKFKEIKSKEWLPAINSYLSGSGLTFEKALGKEEDQFCYPDFYGIEIKTKLWSSKYPTSLFCLSPITNYINPMECITNKFGYPDKDFKNLKVLKGDIFANKTVAIGINYLFKTIVDDSQKCIRLCIFDKMGNKIVENVRWDFDDLEKIINIKMQTLALVHTLHKKENKIDYYKYYKMEIYQFKSFENFIELIKNGTISIQFKVSRFKSGKRIYQIHDHGTAFRINENNFSKLYNKIYTFM